MFIYAVAISGMIVQWHYCSGNLESWKVAVENSQKACCCTTADDVHEVFVANSETDDCCSNVAVELSIEKDYGFMSTTIFDKIAHEFTFILPTTYYFNILNNILQVNVALDTTIKYNAPPVIGYPIPIYKQLNQFLLYDRA